MQPRTKRSYSVARNSDENYCECRVLTNDCSEEKSEVKGMLDKDKVLEVLEKERQFAVQINEPKMALGIAQAIQVVRGMKEEIKVESGLCIICGDDGTEVIKGAVYCKDCKDSVNLTQNPFCNKWREKLETPIAALDIERS